MGWSKFSLAALLSIAGIIAITDAAARGLATSQARAPQPQGVKPAPQPAQQPASPQKGPATTAPPPAAAAVPVRPASPPSAPPTPPARFLIVLDAAHGGDDFGGHLSSDQLEKNATLALSVRLRSLLGARGIQVITTRESDQAVDLDRRAEIANHANARACISLHAADTGSGVHLFASSQTPAAPSRFIAWKTAQAGWVTRSLALAGVLNSALLHAGMGVTLGRTALPAIDSMTCPAVAVEVAPERDSDHKVTAEPDDPDYQARVAAALAAAVLEWRSQALHTETGPAEAHQP
jgi:N-acetylmuramoyl-L-alanine amidase